MQQLQLPNYSFHIKKIGNGFQIFDDYRKKYVKLTPEEWVRQNFLRFLIEEKGFSKGLVAVETELKVNDLKKRCDAIFYSPQAQPLVIVELKAPNVPITQEVFDQTAVYNTQLNVNYLIISNGLVHFCCRIHKKNNSYEFLKEIPHWTELIQNK